MAQYDLDPMGVLFDISLDLRMACIVFSDTQIRGGQGCVSIRECAGQRWGKQRVCSYERRGMVSEVGVCYSESCVGEDGLQGSASG